MDRVATLKRVLPYLREHRGKTFVVRLGGRAPREASARRGLVDDLSVLDGVGVRVVVVHDLGAAGGDDLVSGLKAAGALAVGLRAADLLDAASAGVDADDEAAAAPSEAPAQLDPKLLRALTQGGFLAVIAAESGADDDAGLDADALAERLAAALCADKLLLLGDARGLHLDPDDPGSLLSWTDAEEIAGYLRRGAFAGELRATLELTLAALAAGVAKVHVASGLQPSALLLEVFTNEGCGTLVVRDKGATPVVTAATAPTPVAPAPPA
jgi:acetylglutamate kinase